MSVASCIRYYIRYTPSSRAEMTVWWFMYGTHPWVVPEHWVPLND